MSRLRIYGEGRYVSDQGIIDLPEGSIPEKGEDGLIPSPLEVIRDEEGEATEILSDVPINSGSGTFRLGFLRRAFNVIMRGVTELKDAGISFLAVDNIQGTTQIVPLTMLDPRPLSKFGVGRTTVLTAPPFTTDNFGGTDTSTVTVSGDQKIIVTFTQLGNAFNIAQQFRGLSGKMDYNVIDRNAHDGVETVVYTSTIGEPIDFDSTTLPDFQFDYETENPNFLRFRHQLRLEFFSSDGEEMQMRGQTIGTIPPTGGDDLVNVFIPYFGTTFSFTEERVIFPNDRVDTISSDTEILGSFIFAVDTTSTPVTLTVNPDDSEYLEVFDSKGTFATNNCTLDLLIENTRAFPNDSITSVNCTEITATDIDAGASGTKNALSEGATPKLFHDGTNWKVITDAETLDFTAVTVRAGLLIFRILGTTAVLTIDGETQDIQGISGTKVVVDNIGNSSDPIDEIVGLKLVIEDGLAFDDKVVGTTTVLNRNGSSRIFYFDGTAWNNFRTAAADITFDPSTLKITDTNVQDAIDATNRDDLLIIKSLSDFPTPVSGVITLEDGVIYVIQDTVDIGTNRIVMGELTVLRADTGVSDILKNDSASALLTSVGKNFIIRNVGFQNDSGDILDIDGSLATKSMRLEGVFIHDCASIGTIKDIDFCLMDELRVFNTTVGGLNFEGSNVSISISEGAFRSWTGTLIDLGTATFDVVAIGGSNVFETSSGNTVISGLTNSGNINTGGGGIIFTNIFISEGTYISGINECDTLWILIANVGVESTNIGASIHEPDSSTTTITTVNVVVPVNGIFIEDGSCKFTTDVDGLLTYIGVAPIKVNFQVKMLVAPATSNNIDYVSFVQKNSTDNIAISEDSINADSGTPAKITMFGSVELVQNDTLRLVIKNTTDTRDAIISSIAFVVSQ